MALLAYLFGIGIHSLFPFFRFSDGFWACVLPIVAVGGVIAWRSCRRSMVLRIFVFLCVAVFGVWRFDVTIPSPNGGILSRVGEEVRWTGTVQRVASYGSGKKLIVSAPGASVVVSYFGRLDTRVGSTVVISCMLRALQDPLAARQGAWATCAGKTQIDMRAAPSAFNAFARLAEWHDALTQRILSLFPRDEGTLVTGILYGDQQLSADQRDLMQRAGLMHIVAVSGSNVTIVVSVLLASILALGIRRKEAFYVLTIGVIAFSIFVGGSSSVVRAAIMGWLVLLARHVGRAPKTSRLLLLSAVGLVTANPWVLGFDVGFALSFLATWGLLAWTPRIAERVTWIPDRFELRETFAATSGATLMTLPYMGWIFGRMSLAGIATNLLALPLVPFIMLWGAIAALIGPAFPYSTIPAYSLTVLLEHVAHLADAVPFLDLHFEQLDVVVMIALYAVLAWIWFSLRRKNELSTKKSLFSTEAVTWSPDSHA